jgi:hypothetical protein
MQGFTPRDYIVSALIIIGVLAAWFLLLASLMGLINPQISLSLTIVVGLIVYVIIKRKKLRH